MKEEPATIGIDIGTSGAKGVLLSVGGKVLARADAAYPLLTPRPGWTEQDPEDWWQAAVVVLRRLVEAAGSTHRITGIGLSGQMHGSVFLDEADRPIRPALLWNDARTHAACAEIERRVGRERVIEITGNRASTGMQAPKLLWLRAHEPEAAARVAKLLLPKDFVRVRLTGGYATDAADASGTLLLDLRQRRWSEEMLTVLDIRRELLPEVLESPEPTGGVSEEAAALTGLPAGTPVVAGGGDNACAAIGAGLIEEGHGVCSLGTSGTLFVHSMTPRIDPEGSLNAFCDAVPGGYHLMGVILSAGGALQWFKERIVPGEADLLARNGLDPFAVLLGTAEAVPPGAEGLLFLPYLAGERSPHMDPHARGAWVGLSLAHHRGHLVRALIEGVGFAFADCLERMRALGIEPPGIMLTGGGAKAELWRAILAAQLRAPLTVGTAAEGPALGAAILAQVGAGLHRDLASAVRAAVPPAPAPRRAEVDLAERYRALHARYRALYPALKDAGAFASES
ncbi:xylulokinase [Benzoatithermus flavus]|uniref:Xylulose kinase n=1 Tax=Benzoatithermus flavus TaxID=3108223 RepID=A0ABU8XMS7_9PROT